MGGRKKTKSDKAAVAKAPAPDVVEANGPQQKNTRVVNRPEKRGKLVRWDIYKDQLVPLAIRYECEMAGLVLPWDKIAKHVSPTCSGEALLQHLSKVREARLKEGLPVPPARMGKKFNSLIARVQPPKRAATVTTTIVAPPVTSRRSSNKRAAPVESDTDGLTDRGAIDTTDESDYRENKRTRRYRKPQGPRRVSSQPDEAYVDEDQDAEGDTVSVNDRSAEETNTHISLDVNEGQSPSGDDSEQSEENPSLMVRFPLSAVQVMQQIDSKLQSQDGGVTHGSYYMPTNGAEDFGMPSPLSAMPPASMHPALPFNMPSTTPNDWKSGGGLIQAPYLGNAYFEDNNWPASGPALTPDTKDILGSSSPPDLPNTAWTAGPFGALAAPHTQTAPSQSMLTLDQLLDPASNFGMNTGLQTHGADVAVGGFNNTYHGNPGLVYNNINNNPPYPDYTQMNGDYLGDAHADDPLDNNFAHTMIGRTDAGVSGAFNGIGARFETTSDYCGMGYEPDLGDWKM